SGVLGFVFHSLFASDEEARSGLLDPQQAITESIFREFIAYFKDRHYEFISAKDVESDSLPPGRYVFITFDDGYRNNLRALPVLEEFKVPAVFCVCPNHIREQKSFWWDTLYRELKKQGKCDDAIYAEGNKYKRFTNVKIESLLKKR